MLKKAILIIVLLAFAGGGIGLYLYYKPARSYRHARPDISVQAEEMIRDFATDEKAAEKKYLNKVVEVQGNIYEISLDDRGLTSINLFVDNEVTMISCAMDSADNAEYSRLTKGSNVKIQGQCSGLLMDIVMNKCVLVKQ